MFDSSWNILVSEKYLHGNQRQSIKEKLGGDDKILRYLNNTNYYFFNFNHISIYTKYS